MNGGVAEGHRAPVPWGRSDRRHRHRGVVCTPRVVQHCPAGPLGFDEPPQGNHERVEGSAGRGELALLAETRRPISRRGIGPHYRAPAVAPSKVGHVRAARRLRYRPLSHGRPLPPENAGTGSMAGLYERHRPEDRALHCIVREHLEEFLRGLRKLG